MQGRADFERGIDPNMKSDNLLLICHSAINSIDNRNCISKDLEIDLFVDSIVLQPLSEERLETRNNRACINSDTSLLTTQSSTDFHNQELDFKSVGIHFSDKIMNFKNENSLNVLFPSRTKEINFAANDIKEKESISKCNSFSSHLDDGFRRPILHEEKENFVNCDFKVDDIKVEVLDEEYCINDTHEVISNDKHLRVYKRRRGRPRVLFRKTHSCNICYKVFTRKTHLTTHLRIHSDEKPFRCSVCSKQFRDNSVLIKHIRVHTQDRPYICATCGKAFTQKGNMTRHARQHTNEKPFTCSVCSNGFTTKSHLQTHFRIHVDEKPFTCTLCEKSFRQKSHLMRHLLIHSREKPYSCNLCNKRFRQEQHVTRHKIIHIKGLVTNILSKQCISNSIQPVTL